jgi:glycosyltransferase involved in cell wall biosynthesis
MSRFNLSQIELLYLAFHGVLALFALVNSRFWTELNQKPSSSKKISILIPARNEARNLEKLLPSLLTQNAPNLEILVLNDRSEDDTAVVLEQFRQVKVLNGLPLPDNWLGKNWACHQLSKAATGEILIFTDADTTWQSFTANAIAANLEQSNADALCAWAAQEVTDPISKLIQPLQQWSLLAFLPLFFVPLRMFKVAVAANGQCLAFTRDTYNRIGGHEFVKRSVIEDMALARAVKHKRGKFLLFNGANAISTKMYASSEDAFEGYAKNVYPAFGASPTAFFAATTFNLGLYLLPWLLLPFWDFAWLAIVFSLFPRVISDHRNKYDPLYTIFHPIGIAVWALIGFESLRRYHAGKITWKGREYDLRP